MKKRMTKTDIESGLEEFKEKLRLYCQKKLKNETSRKNAAKSTGYEFSYLSAALGQRNRGGFEFWFKLVYFCASLEVDIDKKLQSFFALDSPFDSFNELSESDIIFQSLSEISLVTEDVKYRLATNLRDMLEDLDKDVAKKLRRRK